MTRLWTKKSACVWAVAAVMAAGVIAHAAQTLRIVPLVHDDQVLVSFEVPDGYTNDVRDAILSGLQTTFSYNVELRMRNRIWVDVLVDKAIVSTTDRYDNLTRRHTLTRTVDGRETDSITTENESVVRQWLTALDKLPICRTTKLDPSRDYYVQVSARVLPDKTSMLGLTSAIVGRSPFTFIP